MVYKKVTLLFLMFLFLGEVVAAQGNAIVSPNKKIEVVLESKDNNRGSWFLRVSYQDNGQYHVVIPAINIGIVEKGASFTSSLKLLNKSKNRSIVERYTALHGKRLSCSNQANEGTWSFTNNDGKKLDLVVRAYNDGIAFKYVLKGRAGDVVLMDNEATSYNLKPDNERWLQSFVPSYEGFYNKQKGIEKGQWGYPGLFKVNTGSRDCWLLITEAGLDSTYCATKLGNTADADIYKLLYPSASDGNHVGSVNPTVTLPWNSPWRVVIIGGLSDLTESTLVEDVSEPSKIKDTNWIKPGNSSWVYWAYNHGTKDYKKLTEYIDLAARMNWPYTLFDWEWDAMGNGGNLEDAVKYAASKGIKPMIWYNSGGPHNGVTATPRDRVLTHESRMKEFAWLNKIGVYGIKVDFFESDKQSIIKYYLDILEDAAKFKLMVNFHGATVPRGWSRTYPNLMSMEAVYGAEQYNNGGTLTYQGASHNATLPFTRNVVGPMDYTPVTFTNSQHPHTTTFAHELALSVIFESGIQHMADRPSGYDALPDAPKFFLKNVPNSWDSTKFVDGYPGKRVILARSKGNTWYLAGINGEDRGGKIKIDLKFLSAGKAYKVTVIADGDNDMAFQTSYTRLDRESPLEINWLPRGGFTAVFQEM